MLDLKPEGSLLSAVLDHVSDGVAVHDADWKYLYVNEAYCKTVGKATSEVIGKNIWDLWPEWRHSEIHDRYEQIRTSGEPATFKVYEARNDRWHETTVRLAGETTVSVMRDITTEQLEASKAIERADRLTFISDAIPVLISYVDSNFRYQFCNDGYERWFGHPKEEFIGRSMADVLGEAAFELVRPYVAKAFAGMPQAFDMVLPYKDGGDRHVSVHYAPDQDANGEVRGIAVLVTDLSTQRRSEEALRISDERLRVTLKNTPVILTNNDRDLVYTWMANPISEFRSTSIVGKRSEDFLPKETAEVLDAAKREVIETGEGVRKELSVKAGGTERLIDMTIEPLRNADNEIIGTTNVAIDTTEWRTNEQRLRFLAKVSETLANTLNEPDIAQKVVDLAITSFADYCAIFQPDEANKVGLISMAVSDPDRRKVVETLIGRYERFQSQGSAKVIETGEPVHIEHVTDEMLERLCADKEDLELCKRSGLRSMIAVPLQSRGRVIGAISFALMDDKRYKASDIEFARMLGRRIAAALDNAKLYRSALNELEERKRTEEENRQLALALEEERMRLANIIGSVPGVVYETRGEPGQPDYRITYVSDSIEEWTGFSPERMISDPSLWLKNVPPEEFPKIVEQARAIPPEQEFGVISYRMNMRDGSIIDAESHFRTVKNAAGERIGRCGVLMDVTKRKTIEREREQTERALTESRTQLMNLMSNLAGLAYRAQLNAPWAFEYASNGCVELTGYEPARFHETGDIKWGDIIHPDDRAFVETEAEKSIRDRSPIEIEYRIVHASGEERFVLDRAVVLYDDDGEPIAFEGIVVDITDLRKTQEALVSANRAKDQFIAALSHELRTPLTPVRTCLETLRDDTRLPADVKPLLDMMERNINLEVKLIDDLLDLTRIIRGKIRLDRTRTDVTSLLQSAIDICEPKMREKSIKMELDLKASNTSVDCDSARVQQVLWNLMQNAVKFTHNGGKIRISTWTTPAKQLYISITDSGIGIPRERLRTIFTPFEQGDATITRMFGGLGLGLAIAKRIVDLHGGTIEALSEGHGKGSTFVVSLPLSGSEMSLSVESSLSENM